MNLFRNASIYIVHQSFFSKVMVGLLCFFLMLFSSGANQPFRYGLMIGLFFLIAIILFFRTGRLTSNLSHQLLFMTLFYASLGSFYCLEGYLYGNPGAGAMIQPYILYPFVLLLFIIFSCDYSFIASVPKVIVFSGAMIGLYGLVFFFVKWGALPSWLYFDIGVVNAYSAEPGHVGLGTQTLIQMLFIMPFIESLLVLRLLEGEKVLDNTVFIFVAFLLGFAFSLLTGRRSLWTVILIAPFLTLIFSFFRSSLRKRIRWRLVIFFPFVAVVVLMFVQWLGNTYFEHDLYERFEPVINMFFDQPDSSIAHKERQSSLMLEEWSNAPLLGAGFGSVVEGISSSDITPWAYEATYALMLHNTGIIGIILYSIGIIWLYAKGFWIIKYNHRWSSEMIAVLVGMSCFFLANATNPYLGHIDTLWMLAYPLVIINMNSSIKKRGI